MRPAAPQPPDELMAELSALLFTVGTIILAVAFAAHVGHAVLLANGRRAALVIPAGFSGV